MSESGSANDTIAPELARMVEEKRASQKKKRTPMSCDRCKSRKTKCIDPSPGPCRYCASIGATCRTDMSRRKQRPYYHVSEEEYRYMARIVRHYVPDKELNLANLRGIVQEIDGHGDQGSETKQPLITPQLELSTPPDGNYFARQNEHQDSPEIDEVDQLHRQLGCLMIDSRGKYRYIGAESGISFNAAVRALREGFTADTIEREIIPSMRTASLPPQTPESSVGAVHVENVFLPPKQEAERYAARFFEQVHCVYWFFSSEDFHTRLEMTYYDFGATSSASWLCSLYSIFSMGSEGLTGYGDFAEAPAKTATEYLLMSKALVSRVCDEADLDSIRALMLLGLALQTACFTNTSYLYIGTAVRIAYSLGLQVDKYPLAQGFIEREHARRIWWTLYIMDQEIAMRYGNPPAIPEDSFDKPPPVPSEQILSPGTYTPLGYLAVSTSFSRLKKRISRLLYAKPTTDAKRVSIATVYSLLTSLRDWLAGIPSHLGRSAHVAPTHKRAVAVLHLKYWGGVILVTRPFLLYTIMKGDELTNPEKKKWFEELAQICLDAAQNSLSILKGMRNDEVLSSIVNFDCTCLLELVQIFLLGLAKTGEHVFKTHLTSCLSVLNSMEMIGWCKQALPEITAQLQESGALEEERSPSADETIEAFFSHPPELEFLPPTHRNDGFDIEYSDLFFGSMDFTQSDAPDDMLQQIEGLSRLPTFNPT